MTEEIILGILGAVVGLAAYVSARKMARGPVHYYGQTIHKRTPAPIKPLREIVVNRGATLEVSEAAAVEILLHYLEASETEVIPKRELLRLMRHYWILKKHQPALEPTFLKLETRMTAETRKGQDPALNRESQERRIDDLERRVLALEKRSSPGATVESSERPPVEVPYVQ